ncbi:site-specific integrase [Pedobacter sp. SL55]|uniref:site-specific integrase n=1 Tax=Pedobacter sp. SL55 TaxID=2995161 RepID=UPI00226F1BCD|nr:site-specific integrase [Pedobacter sp. SL55]WAC39386.1 site-specific integrase [Pedobacter sp. SL55]
MKTQNTFSVSFFLRKDKGKEGIAPLYARITVNGTHADLATKRKMLVEKWDQKSQSMSGKTAEDNLTRDKIRLLGIEINSAYEELRRDGAELTAETVKAKVEGTEIAPYTLMFLIDYHNEELKQFLEEGTMKNYRTTKRYLTEFLIVKWKRKDILLKQLDNLFVTKFGLFLLTRTPDKGQRPCSNNSVMKHMERLKKLVGLALQNKWMTENPFQHFKKKIITKDRDCLDTYELDKLRNLELRKVGVSTVRDMFLFACLTGLSPCDITRFNKDHITRDVNGEYWIEMYRQKTKRFTERKFNVLLLPEALEIIKKYRRNAAAIENGTVFPFYTNQILNRYLKVIAEEAEINKPVTFHLARHTFATTVTLENGVPIESVSHMLGHASIRTTQIYSKIKKKKVLNDMKYETIFLMVRVAVHADYVHISEIVIAIPRHKW